MSEQNIHVSGDIGTVLAVCRNAEPGLPKPVVEEVRLREDWGVEGDYHAGKFVRHRYLARKDPTKPNIRQVCLLDASIFSELALKNIYVGPGMMGENITIEGLELMKLAIGTRLNIADAQVELTEIRIPCDQLNGIDSRLLKATVSKEDGKKVFKAGIMARVIRGGMIRAGDKVVCIYQEGGG